MTVFADSSHWRFGPIFTVLSKKYSVKKRMIMIKETDLYPPIKSYFNDLGYEVKSEVNHCDVVAKKADEALIIVELKTRVNLELILQASERLSLTEKVYIAFPADSAAWKKQWRRIRKLCRRLGIGIITLEGKTLKASLRLEPGPYKARGSIKRQKRLLAEFDKRVGDGNVGGSNRRALMTAYKQDVLLCLAAFDAEQMSLAEIRLKSGVGQAAAIMQKNHYGWFERVTRGRYKLSNLGIEAKKDYSELIEQLLFGNNTED